MTSVGNRNTNAESTSPLLHDGDGRVYGEESIGREKLPLSQIFAILAPGFSWGCVSTTMLLLTLPLECQRVANTFKGDSGDNTSSIFLGLFVFLAGLTELMCPLMGKMSDESITIPYCWGRRIPFILMGSFMSMLSLLGMSLSSWFKKWIIYAIAYTFFMIGMNIVYSSMIALIPDLIPTIQVGQANGVLALEMVLGSLFGFLLFQAFSIYNNSHGGGIDAVAVSVVEMYTLYALVLIVTCIFAVNYTKEKTDINVFLSEEKRTHSSNTSPSSFNMISRFSKLNVVWKDAISKVFKISGGEFLESYIVTRSRHGDFFYVTISRTFYYMGISVQTFFLYYIHDILRKHSAIARESPQTLVSTLALVVQFAGAFTSYPAGYISDKCINGRRKPLIYWSCAMLSVGTLALIFIRYVNQLKFICVIVGLANGGYLTMETSLAVDSLEKLEEEFATRFVEEELQIDSDDVEGNKKEGSAQLLGIWGVAAFVGVALGPLIGGPLLFLLGTLNKDELDDMFDDDYVGGQEYTLLGYIIVFSLSAIYFALAAYVLRWVKNCH